TIVTAHHVTVLRCLRPHRAQLHRCTGEGARGAAGTNTAVGYLHRRVPTLQPVGVLAFVSRWALSGRRWGQAALAVWVGSHAVLGALGAILVASAPDWVLGWAPHTPAVQALPSYYWAFPAARLIVLLAAGLAVFGSPDVAAFWADQRGRRVAALSP